VYQAHAAGCQASLLDSLFQHTGQEPVLVGLDSLSVGSPRLEDVVHSRLEVLVLAADNLSLALVFGLRLVGLVLVVGVLEVLDGRFEAELVAHIRDDLGNLDDRGGPQDLIVDREIVRPLVGLNKGQLRKPFDVVFQRDERLSLFALAVDGHRIAGDDLCGEAVGDRPETTVEVETRLRALAWRLSSVSVPWVMAVLSLERRTVGDRQYHISNPLDPWVNKMRSQPLGSIPRSGSEARRMPPGAVTARHPDRQERRLFPGNGVSGRNSICRNLR